MKYKGTTLKAPNREIVIIPRGDGEDICLYAQAVLDMKPFDKMCPPPLPPSKIVKGGRTEVNLEDETFQKQCKQHGEKRMAWLFIHSYNLPENDLAWETVDFADHKSWLNYEQELRDSGFSDNEIARLKVGAWNANSLNEMRMQEAKSAFLRRVATTQEK